MKPIEERIHILYVHRNNQNIHLNCLKHDAGSYFYKFISYMSNAFLLSVYAQNRKVILEIQNSPSPLQERTWGVTGKI